MRILSIIIFLFADFHPRISLCFVLFGLVFMAILPEVFPSPFIGILLSVVLYAVGSGLIEVLVSPSMVGTLSEVAGGNLKAGLTVATIFPIILVCVLLIVNQKNRKGGRV